LSVHPGSEIAEQNGGVARVGPEQADHRKQRCAWIPMRPDRCPPISRTASDQIRRFCASAKRPPDDRLSSPGFAGVRDGGGNHRRGRALLREAAVYGLGLIGSLVYHWQHAAGFWAHVWAVIEAILWPAFVIYHLLGHLAS